MIRLRITTLLKVLAFVSAALVALCACSDHDEHVWDELPQPIAEFIQKYWPGSFARDYEADYASFSVQIANGPELTFDSQYNWKEIDGEGMPLPQMLLYDQLPAPLYQYLEEGQLTDQVFEIERDARTYEVNVLSQEIYYTIATGQITTRPTTPTSPR